MIEFLGSKSILPAREWLALAIRDGLGENDLCLTFDDSLRCQYDVALPVLEDYGLTGFWFVYSSVFEGRVDSFEVYRYYRTTQFDSINRFYESFFEMVDGGLYGREVREALDGFDPPSHMPDFPFYTSEDRTFRYVRDRVLGDSRYREIMDAMVSASPLDIEALRSVLWIDDSCLKELDRKGHVVGLYSYSHPMDITELSREEQREEFNRNFRHLNSVLGKVPVAMSHPCNEYNHATLEILGELGIRLGFRANTAKPESDLLEMPREDHTNVLRRMESK